MSTQLLLRAILKEYSARKEIVKEIPEVICCQAVTIRDYVAALLSGASIVVFLWKSRLLNPAYNKGLPQPLPVRGRLGIRI
jgi:hypothetical protein